MLNVCNLCHEDFETTLAYHYMMFHPTQHSNDPIETWPDGGFVCVDSTLLPDDFNSGGEHQDEG